MTIVNEINFLQAEISIGRTVVWAPHGGYADFVAGCSAHSDCENSNILFNLPDVCVPDVDAEEWFYTGCVCTEGHPCMFRVIPEQLY